MKPSISGQPDEDKNDFLPGNLINFRTKYDADIPKEGVINRCGYLFHHFLPFRVTAEHVFRLQEYGIKYKKNERFTKEEDDRIRKNWRKFSEKHGFQYEDAHLYVGFLGKEDETPRRTRRQNDCLVKLGMFPRLCHKLENRSANQVQIRMCYIFDPHYAGQPDSIPLETALETYMRLKEGEHIVDLALEYRYPYVRLIGALAKAKLRAREIGCTIKDLVENPTILDEVRLPEKEYRRFYKVVLRRLNQDDYWIRTAIMECKDTWKSVIKKEMEQMNWTRIIPNFKRQNEKSLKKSWWRMLKLMRNEYYSELEANFIGNEEAITDESREMAWITAKNKIIPPRLKNLSTIRKFLKAFAKCVTNEEQGLQLDLVDKEKLTKKLIGYGLVADTEYNLVECELYKTVRGLLQKWNRSFFRFIDFPLGVKDKVSIAKICYNRLCDFHGDRNPDQFDHLPHITKSLLVECTILYLRKLSENEWTPPAFLRKYIKKGRVIDYFRPSTSSGIREEEKELRLFRKTVFCDENCLRVPRLDKVSRKTWQDFKKRAEERDEPEVLNPPEQPITPRGWHQDVVRKRKIRVIDYSKCGPSKRVEATNVTEIIDAERNKRVTAVEEVDDIEVNPELEETLNTIVVAENNDILEFSETESPPKKRQRENSPDLFASSGDDLMNEEEDFSHLIINTTQKSSKKARSPVGTDLTWSSVFA